MLSTLHPALHDSNSLPAGFLWRVKRMLRSAVDWRPMPVSLPRHLCHFIELDVEGIPSRLLAGSLSLQLRQLTGLSSVGFAYLPQGPRAVVWYWDEANEEVVGLASAARRENEMIELWPETIRKSLPANGVYIARCTNGVEALAMKAGRVRRTRWFAEMPDAAEWLRFLRDMGSAETVQPEVGTFPVSRVPPPGWKLHSAFREPISFRAWAVTGLGAVLGAAVIVAAVYQLKLDRAIDREQAIVNRIEVENAGTIAIQRQIVELLGYIDGLQLNKPKSSQLGLMAELAASGVFDERGDISLLEWEYRGGRLRLLFAVPADSGSLEKFLARLESIRSFDEIRLLPDSPPRTIEIQAAVKPQAMPLIQHEDTGEAEMSAEGRRHE